jgi:hypothetical protein
MWKAEKARYALAVKRAELNTAALLVLAIICFLPLMGEQDCNGTHAWESIDLALLGVPVWCIAFLYRGWCFESHRRDMVVYGLLLVYELVLVVCHMSLLWGVRTVCCWHILIFSSKNHTDGSVWGWLPGHVCLLVLVAYMFLLSRSLNRRRIW